MRKPPGIQLFRALVPSWRFFDSRLDALALYYRFGPDEDRLSPYHPALKPHGTRGWGSLFLNPHENLRLAACSAVEILIQEAHQTLEAEVERIEQSVSYQIVLRIARQELRRSQQSSVNHPKIIQFKITAEEDLLISKVHEA